MSFADALFGVEGRRRREDRSTLGRALDAEPPVKRGHAVAEPDDPGTARVSAAEAVVANLEVQRLVLHGRPDLGLLGAGVLDDVRQSPGTTKYAVASTTAGSCLTLMSISTGIDILAASSSTPARPDAARVTSSRFHEDQED
jgi:hypothetical protein